MAWGWLHGECREGLNLTEKETRKKEKHAVLWKHLTFSQLTYKRQKFCQKLKRKGRGELFSIASPKNALKLK